MARICGMPHVTVRKLQGELAKHAVSVSHDTIWRLLRDRGLSYKKCPFADEQRCPDVVRKRKRWMEYPATHCA